MLSNSNFEKLLAVLGNRYLTSGSSMVSQSLTKIFSLLTSSKVRCLERNFAKCENELMPTVG